MPSYTYVYEYYIGVFKFGWRIYLSYIPLIAALVYVVMFFIIGRKIHDH